MPCTSFSKALIVLGVSWSMSKLELLLSLLELLLSLSKSLSLSKRYRLGCVRRFVKIEESLRVVVVG